jgi:diguanylate cyclase (GGDEF)-like protein
MAKILVVDDNASNRRAVLKLLQHEGYTTSEATDGVDGLRVAEIDRPQLIISDILMPSMDGYEFVRQLRAKPSLAPTAVIYYTANYHRREAATLAEQCGVARVIAKPCSAKEFLRAVSDVISGIQPTPVPKIDREFQRNHLRVLTNKLSTKADQLSALNSRFVALTALNVQLASERDPSVLLDRVCAGSRSLLGAKYAVLAIADKQAGIAPRVWTSGIDLHGGPPPVVKIDEGLPGHAYIKGHAVRALRTRNTAMECALPSSLPRAAAALAVPIQSHTRIYGWLCLADKLGAVEFDVNDERMLSTLGALVGRIYENGSLYLEVQQHAAQLRTEIDERKEAEARILQLSRVHAMLSGINSLIVRVSNRDELFNEACRLAVEEGRFRVAWCGMLDSATGMLRVVASSGDLPELPALLTPEADDRDGHDNLIMTSLRSQKAEICNNLLNGAMTFEGRDALVGQGFRGIAVFPLITAGKSVGCLVLMTAEIGLFDAAESRLLVELAGDISFALDHIDKLERLNYLAYYDSLTGLANPTLFGERLAIHVGTAVRNESHFALVMLGPDRFQGYNEALGRASGDELLRTLAERFVRTVGSSDLVARLGPEQFAVIIPDSSSAYTIQATIERWWHDWLGAAFHIGGQELTISAKAGIAMFPADGTDAETLLRNAQAALKKAKDSSSKQVFYTPNLSDTLTERLTLENQMRRALGNEEFILHYQPKVDMVDRRIAGFEALMRWQNPRLGLIPPSKFIPIMEETGLIVEVGAWAMRQAIQDRTRWLEMGLPAPRIAVNVSAIQLRHEDFVRTIATTLNLIGRDAGIDIEVTESVLLDDVSDNIDKLVAIRDLGVNIALDDFGTGYSSLSYLARLPVAALKIDRSFVTTMLDDPSATALVSTIISLARSLKLETVAEGVESEEQAKILRLLQCDQMQGFLISRPIAFDDMTVFLRHTRSSTSRTDARYGQWRG